MHLPDCLTTQCVQSTILCRSCMPVTALNGCQSWLNQALQSPKVTASLSYCHRLPQLPAVPTAAASQVLLSGPEATRQVAMCCLLQIIAFTAGWRMTLVVLATLPLTVAAYGVQSRFLIGFSAQVSSLCKSCSLSAAGCCCWTPV